MPPPERRGNVTSTPAGPRVASRRVKALAREIGFDLVRVAHAEPLDDVRGKLLSWIEEGRPGEMRWITPEWGCRASSPQNVLPGARSVVCVGLSYWAGSRRETPLNRGRIARYAWGADYHAVLGTKLAELAARLAAELGGSSRWYVDTGPLLDKALAARAGLGWYGKNTNILTERFGSLVLLGEIVTSVELEPDGPLERDCGSCRLCLVACPTGALGPEYSIDSRKCISYLTIEHRGPIPHDLRPLMGSWVFGCDVCQDVCPPTMMRHLHDRSERREWAAQVREEMGTAGAGGLAPDGDRKELKPPPLHPLFPGALRQDVDLIWLLELSHGEYLRAFRNTSIRRAKVWMLRRNAAVALGNVGTADAVQPLIRALHRDEHALVRGHAAWALGALGHRLGMDVSGALISALASEQDEGVRREIELAVSSCGSSSA